MSSPTAEARVVVPTAAPEAGAYVIPKHLATEATGPGPRFSDPEWDFTPFVPRTVRDAKIRFEKLPDPVAQYAAREYFRSRITRAVPHPRRSHDGAQPMKLTWVRMEFDRYVAIVEALAALGVARLGEATQEHFDELLKRWTAETRSAPRPRATQVTDRRQRARSSKPSSEGGALNPKMIGNRVRTVKHMAQHRRYVIADALAFEPWPGRAATHVVKDFLEHEENITPRIPEAVMAPLLRAAVFYVSTASADILAARDELARLDAADQARPGLGYGQVRARLREFIELRRRQGRGIPALPPSQRAKAPDAPIRDGVIEHPNFTLTFQLADISPAWHYRQLICDAADELGYEEGGLDTLISPWPDAGRPWRARLDRPGTRDEIYHLRVACWIVIAYLSGMRDPEVRELGRDCAAVAEGQDGRPRYTLHGRVFKGRQLTGDEADWVVLDVVHQAVNVLRQINDDPTHLFGYRSQMGHYTLLDELPALLDDFRDHINTLFSTDGGPYIPLHEETRWYFNTRQFRRTLAWHLAHQPFGVVAGARQYKHAKVAMFEGYAGTSSSGFAAEVAAEEAVAMLDYLEELFHDWNEGHAATGGAAGKINAEFDRIRREIGDLPGVVAEPARLRTMLGHLAKTLHPGVLNDCFFQAATAVCVKRAKIIGRPVPQHSMCLRCPNARRSAVHLPRLTAARDQALELHAECQHAGPVPKPQEIAITGYITELDQIIGDLEAAPEARP